MKKLFLVVCLVLPTLDIWADEDSRFSVIDSMMLMGNGQQFPVLDSVITTDGDGRYEDRLVYRYNAEGKQIYFSDEEYEEGVVSKAYRQVDTYDEQGNLVNIDYYDVVDGQLTLTYKSTYTYGDQNRIERYYDCENNESKLIFENEEKYDSHGNIVESIYYYSSYPLRRYVYGYDEQNRQILKESYEGTSAEGEWILTKVEEKLYDEAGLVVMYSTKNCYSSIHKYSDGTRVEKCYSKEGWETCKILSDWKNDAWVYVRKTEIQYTGHGLQSCCIVFNWEEGAWVKDHTELYTYNAQDSLLSRVCASGEGTPTYREDWIFNDAGVCVSTSASQWTKDGWMKYIETTYSFNDQGLLAIEEEKHNDFIVEEDGSYVMIEEWYGSERFVYTYDEAGNKILYQSYCRPGSQRIDLANGIIEVEREDWRLGEQIEYGYDAQGNIVLEIVSRIDECSDSIVYVTKAEYSFDDQGRMLLEANYQWDEGWTMGWKDVYAYHPEGNLYASFDFYVKKGENGEDWRQLGRYEFDFSETGMSSQWRIYKCEGGAFRLLSTRTYYYHQPVVADIEDLRHMIHSSTYRKVMRGGKISIQREYESYSLSGVKR